jgi:uncharacterized membrane protein
MDKETKHLLHMNSLTLLNISLVFHLVGLVLIAGSTFLDFVTTSQFWKFYSENRQEALIMRRSSKAFPVFARIGIALLVLSGISMMAVMHGAYGQQTWMRIKIGLVVLVILNILIVGRRNGTKLFKLLAEESNGVDHRNDLEKMKSRTRLFHISQLVLFLIIFTLSVFKFN